EDAESSDGPRPLAASHYFARLSQRLINALTVPTAEGKLYEVDMRLRPSGNKGPVVSRWDAFLQYQAEQAWTWEHMALTRLRIISDAPPIDDMVRAGVAQVIRRRRDPAATAREVVDMRARIEKEK